MTGVEGSRERMIRATARLLQRQGYAGTGLKQIVEESGAPRGSLYFHFPGGKEELVLTALTHACEARLEAMYEVFRATATASEAVQTVIASLRDELAASRFEDGCPIATVVLEMAATSDPIQRTCATAWRGWSGLIEARLREEGHDSERASTLALTALALLEVSLILARAYRSTEPLDAAKAAIPGILGEPANDNDNNEGRS